MNPDIFRSMFWSNSELTEQSMDYCQEIPGYTQALNAVCRSLEEAEQALSSKQYLALEAALNHFWALDSVGHIFFGMQLRRELLHSLHGEPTL